MLPLISVIVPAYNEGLYIETTLRSLSNQSMDRQVYEIIVVDGSSNDETVDIASCYADKVIVQSGKGIGQARNEGAASSRGEILVHTDSDVLAPHAWLERLYSLMIGGAVAVCGPYYPLEPSLSSSLEFAFMNVSSLLHRFGVVVTRGTNTVVRKRAFHQVGGYSDIPVLDDVELGYRLKRVGKVVCSQEAATWTSTRRFRKNGFLATNLSWIKGDMIIMTWWRLREDYARQDYLHTAVNRQCLKSRTGTSC